MNMNNTKDFLGRGFAFPPAIDKTTGRFKMISEEDDIRQAIYIIIMTRKNERAMMPDFGCDIHNFIFDAPDESAMIMAETCIIDAITTWEPRVMLPNVTVDLSEKYEGRIIFDIQYTVRSTNSAYNMVVPYYYMEGIAR